MFNPKDFDNIYFYRPIVDFRKGINGLCGIVQDEMKLDPFEKYLFVFCNSKRDKIKALYWDETGFALWFKVLQAEKYLWPLHLENDVLNINFKKLNKFLIGYDPWQVGHKKLNYSYV